MEQIEQTCRQIGSSAQSLIEQNKQTKMLEMTIKANSNAIELLEREKQCLIDQLSNFKLSNDFELSELKQEVLKNNQINQINCLNFCFTKYRSND